MKTNRQIRLPLPVLLGECEFTNFNHGPVNQDILQMSMQ